MSEVKITRELHRKTFELTLALYRVTDFFPQGEPLRRQLREKANEIFGSMTEYGYVAGEQEREAILLVAKIQAVKGYLHIARSVRFVRAVNITVLEREYELIGRFFESEIERVKNDRAPDDASDPFMEKKREAHSEQGVHIKYRSFSRDDAETHSVSQSFDINERRKKILAYAKQMPQARVKDFSTFLREVSPKTIQRDLHSLVEQNILKKQGNKRGTLYSVNFMPS